MSEFIKTMPKNLQTILKEASKIDSGNKETAIQSIKNMDITSLKEGDTPMIGIESEEEIKALCEAAQNSGIAETAAICVYPNQIETVQKYLKPDSDIQIAVVNNFPHGTMSAEEAADTAMDAIIKGANEIDTVIDYQAFLEGDVALAAEKLKAVRKVCMRSNVQLKVILKASVYADYEDLYDAAGLAIECGCDFVKTCTGKLPKDEFSNGEADASTLETAATVMQAVKDSGNKKVGVKISGGVKTALDCERIKYLTDNILYDWSFSDSLRFRFGASSLMGNLIDFLNDKSTSDNSGDY